MAALELMSTRLHTLPPPPTVPKQSEIAQNQGISGGRLLPGSRTSATSTPRLLTPHMAVLQLKGDSGSSWDKIPGFFLFFSSFFFSIFSLLLHLQLAAKNKCGLGGRGGGQRIQEKNK